MAAASFSVRQLYFQSNFESLRSGFENGGPALFGAGVQGQLIEGGCPAAMLLVVIPLGIINLMQTIPGLGCWVGNKGDRVNFLAGELHVAPLLRAVHVDDALR